MNFIKLLPVFLSILLLAAHFFRAGEVAPVIVILLTLFILLVRQPWVVRIIQVELVIGAFVWIKTLIQLAMIRHSMGMPWLRLAAILGIVALFSIASAFVFKSASLKKRYRLEEDTKAT